MDNIPLSRLRKFTELFANSTDDTEISFGTVCGSLFPTIWYNVQDEMNRQYTNGYIQGLADSKK